MSYLFVSVFNPVNTEVVDSKDEFFSFEFQKTLHEQSSKITPIKCELHLC